MIKKDYKYEIVFSFAGEDRKYVKEVAECLIKNGITVFYDEFEEDKLWGKDLYDYLDNIYRNEAKFCLMFLSKDYANKLWTNHERKSAQARAFQQNEEYILPIKLDDTEIPGIRPTTGYLDGRIKTPKDICARSLKKLGIKKLDNIDIEDEEVTYIPKIKRTISDLEKNNFLKSSFSEIIDFFQKALIKLKKANKHVETELEQITSSKFVVTIYVEGELKAQCKIWIGSTWGRENIISFLEGTHVLDINNDSSMNDSATITDNSKDIYFNILGTFFGSLEGIENINLKHASSMDVAKYYWARLTNYLKY